MSKFNTTAARPVGSGPIVSESTPSTVTAEGGPGYLRDARSELFLLATNNFVSEQTFYESGTERDDRYRNLITELAVSDGPWVARMLTWLRHNANMRSASLVGAAEYVHARLLAGLKTDNRTVVTSVLARADEPGEFLGYWTQRFGRTLPKVVKRALGDAANSLYTEFSFLKYDSNKHGYRFADVISLAHPKPESQSQSALYEHIVDAARRENHVLDSSLKMLTSRRELTALPVEARRALLSDTVEASLALGCAGMTWESVAGWLQGPMDASAWEAIIPHMGYMALVRNLRNFDEVGVSDEVADKVAQYLAKPENVERSKQLPLRFLSAYKSAHSLRWSWPLSRALDLSLKNVPSLKGRTLILIDTSYSMNSPLSSRSDLLCWDAATTFGLALADRAEHADVVSFSDRSLEFPTHKGESVLASLHRWEEGGYFIGRSTLTDEAVSNHYAGHDRVVILTDEQASYNRDVFAPVPSTVATYTWNLVGYRAGSGADGPNRYTFGGLTDQGFGFIPLLEQGRNADWPF